MPPKHEKTLVFLHGAANQTSMYHGLFKSDFSPVCENTRIVLPQAPLREITFSQSKLKMPSWYDIYTDDRINKSAKDIFNIVEVEKSAAKIQEIMDQEIDLLENKDQMYIGGISQGSALAVYSGLSYKKSIAGIIALSGYFIDTCKINKENSQVPMYWSHGTDDEIVKLDYMKQTIAFLKYINDNLSMEIEEGLAHTIREDQMIKIQKWYQQLGEKKYERNI